MVTSAGEPEAPITVAEAVKDRFYQAAYKAEGGTRNLLAGSPVGAVRRILLYIVVVVALVLDGTAGVLFGGLGLIAVLLLALSDTDV